MKRVRDFHAQSWANPFFGRTGLSRTAKILRWSGLVSIIALVIYVFVYSPLLRINKVTVDGTSATEQKVIETAAAQSIAGYDYLIIPKDHYFLVNKIGVKNFVMAQFPELLSVDIKKKFRRLAMNVVERQPAYRLIIGDKSYLLDQEGKGIREAATSEGDELIALSNNNINFAFGKIMIQADWLQAVINLHKYFATQVGVRDQLFKLDAINSDIEVLTIEGWSAIFDPKSDINVQLKTLSSALAGKFDPNERKKLIYIDVRFGDKIFYKLNQ